MVIEGEVVTRDVLEGPADRRPATFEELFHGERIRLFGALCLLTGDRHEAEDLVQDAFVRVYERWSHVGSLDDPVGYLYRTAMNGFRSHYRRSVMAMRRQLPPRQRADEMAGVERHADLMHRLGRLTTKERAALVLLDLLDLSSDDAGDLLKMSPGAVRTQASRARARLRRMTGDDDA